MRHALSEFTKLILHRRQTGNPAHLILSSGRSPRLLVRISPANSAYSLTPPEQDPTSGWGQSPAPHPLPQRPGGAGRRPYTRRAYLGALARLDAWRGAAPVDDASLAVYLGTIFEAGRARATAALAVAAVRFRAKLAGHPNPAGEATARVLAGFRRTAADRGRG